eukprot:COSAG04_NODE_3918_length_2424_cov_3.585806_4_plen_76_part_00
MVEEQGKLCHRMNGRGVDINRNYDNHFGVHAPEYLPAEEYEGTAAASEPVSHDDCEGLGCVVRSTMIKRQIMISR